jgi:hypothetical protein
LLLFVSQTLAIAVIAVLQAFCFANFLFCKPSVLQAFRLVCRQ